MKIRFIPCFLIFFATSTSSLADGSEAVRAEARTAAELRYQRSLITLELKTGECVQRSVDNKPKAVDFEYLLQQGVTREQYLGTVAAVSVNRFSECLEGADHRTVYDWAVLKKRFPESELVQKADFLDFYLPEQSTYEYEAEHNKTPAHLRELIISHFGPGPFEFPMIPNLDDVQKLPFGPEI